MKLDDKEIQFLRKATKESAVKIKECPTFVALFSTNFEKDPVCAVQLGLAIMLDKPILIIALEKNDIPKNLKKVANHIEYIKDRSFKEMEKASEAIQKFILKMESEGEL